LLFTSTNLSELKDAIVTEIMRKKSKKRTTVEITIPTIVAKTYLKNSFMG
jgi:hypothetical protein